MALKLSETQLALLGAAARRDDQFFTFPDGRRLASARLAANPLLVAGLAREVRARSDAPVWRRDKESQRAFALKLTPAGAKAIAAIADGGKEASQRKPHVGAKSEPSSADRALRRDEQAIAKEQALASFVAPRSGTKIGHVVKMLSRPEGATLAAIVKETGWLQHTTYAALTGLRKRGYALERSRNDDVGPSVYRLGLPTQTGA